MAHNGSEKFYLDAFSSISPPAVWIVASGNMYKYFGDHKNIDSVDRALSEKLDVILVGSLSPDGLVSNFSQEGEELHILAPSDKYIVSRPRRWYEQFGGTSGAAPLVTGSLSGFEWLSGYHPDSEESKMLLEKTAIPTIHSQYEKPRKNGVGLLNAYKLGQVAKRLKKKCGTDKACFKEALRADATYQFPIDDVLFKELSFIFPNCGLEGADSQSNIASCEDKERVFNRLRKAAFLNPSKKELWQILSCIYASNGFTENALGLRMIGVLTRQSMDNVLNKLMEDDEHLDLIRLVGNTKEARGLEILEDVLNDNPTRYAKTQIAYATGQIGEGMGLLNKLSEDPDAGVRKNVVKVVRSLKDSPERSDLLKKLSEDPEAWIREMVVEVVGSLKNSPERSRLLNKLSSDSDDEVAKKALNLIEKPKP